MKILEIKTLEIPDVKVVRYQRFLDHRGYFTETYRKSDIDANPQTSFLKNLQFTQYNESFAKKAVIKGLHFQWNPHMAKLVRTIQGRMIDLFLDIRRGSPTFGKIGAYEMSVTPGDESNEWIFIPVGFAHGNYFLDDTTIEYVVTGQWAPETERGISPLAKDIDWSLCEPRLKIMFDEIASKNPLITDKDKEGLTISAWKESEDSNNFTYSS